MKKIFKLSDEKKQPDRIVDAIKHELRKYTKRERSKKLPDTATMFWDFACKFGQDSTKTQSMEFNDVIKALDGVISAGWSECYIEVIAEAKEKPAKVVMVTPPQETTEEL